MIEGATVNTLSARPTAAAATFMRQPVRFALSPAEALSRLGAEPLAFALTGLWAGGGRPRPPGAFSGGWFGWLGYRLEARPERVPAGPPRPVPMPDFHLAYYDHVLRRDADGQWRFEAPATEERWGELDARRRHLEALLNGEARPVSARGSPLRLDAAAAEAHPGVWHLVSRVRGRLRPGVGNGDVRRADSDPEAELEEALVKARPVAAAVGSSIVAAPRVA